MAYSWMGEFSYATTALRNEAVTAMEDYLGEHPEIEAWQHPDDSYWGSGITLSTGVTVNPDPLPAFRYSYRVSEQDYLTVYEGCMGVINYIKDGLPCVDGQDSFNSVNR